MKERHIHRWRLEEPNGRFSAARCECGAEREMVNSYRLDWELEFVLDGSVRNRRRKAVKTA